MTSDVSIPAGFSDALRPLLAAITIVTDWFQSLLGFLMRCDRSTRYGMNNGKQVSIPAGFSDALRRETRRYLQGRGWKFQSLLGFLMRCDSTIYQGKHNYDIVSIPAGFSDALRQFFKRSGEDASYLFQSLLGFLMRCDPEETPTLQDGRVFQSLLGFLMRCDSMVGSPYQPNRPPKSPEIRDSNHEPPPYHALIKVHDRLNFPPTRAYITFDARSGDGSPRSTISFTHRSHNW